MACDQQLDLFGDVLFPETDEKGCDSFDGLVYVPPNENVSIPCSALSEKQKSFLIDRLCWDKDWFLINPDVNHFHCIKEVQGWFTEAGEIEKGARVITFNDIFIPEDDMQS